MNKIGINLWNWCTGLGEDCCGLPSKIAKMGFTAIELPMTVPAIPPQLADEIRKSGLEVSMCAAMGKGRDLSSFDPDVRESTLEYLTACLDAGASVGAGVLCGPLYAGGGKRHWLEPDEKKREWELAVEGIRKLANRAEYYGIFLGLEPLSRYKTSVVNTAGQALAMADEIGKENVGIHFDTYQACLEEKDLLFSLEQVLKSEKLIHFHACANNRGAPGQGVLPWDQILDLLMKYDYQRHITMETFVLGGLDSSWVQVHEEPDALAQAGLSYLLDYFRRHRR